MKTNTLSVFMGTIAILVSMLACSLGAPAPQQGDGSNSTQDEATAEAPVDNSTSINACDNPYLPIVQGASWTYNLVAATSDTFTRSILSVEANGFTDQDVFGTGVTRQGKWSCDNGALTALDPTGGNSANVSTEGASTDFQTTSASGVTLPAVLNPGDNWIQTVTLEGIQNLNGTEVPSKNEFTNTCTVTGRESVTVTAGTFDTIRVDCQTNMNITVTMNGSPISLPLTFTATNWYAEKVGLIKTVSTGSDLDSTIELTSYSIP